MISIIIKKIQYFVYFRIIYCQFSVCDSIRRWILGSLLGQKLVSVVIRPGVYIFGYKQLKIGDHVSINHNCFLSCDGGLTIGNYVSIGHGTSIITTTHTFINREKSIKYQPITSEPVSIGNNVWIGANVTILSGVSIADGTVVGAGSIITKSINQTDTVVAGNPAKFVKFR